MATNVLRIDTDGTLTEHEVPKVDGSHIAGLRDLIGGGWLEGFQSQTDDTLGLWAYCHDEGRIIGLPENLAASVICGHVAPTLRGPILFVAPDTYDEATEEEEGCPPIPQESIDGLRVLVDVFKGL